MMLLNISSTDRLLSDLRNSKEKCHFKFRPEIRIFEGTYIHGSLDLKPNVTLRSTGQTISNYIYFLYTYILLHKLTVCGRIAAPAGNKSTAPYKAFKVINHLMQLSLALP